METAFPFILQNLHRYFLYLAFVPLFFLWVDAVLVARSARAGPRIGLGGVIFFVNVALLTGYSLSCHSLRHIVGGRLDCFSCSRRQRTQYSLWQRLTALNRHHMAWAWASLISVALADLYVRLLAHGRHHRPGDPLLGDPMTLAASTRSPRSPARRPRHRGRRGRPAGRDRGQGRPAPRRPRLQVAARQGPHRDGRGRRRGGARATSPPPTPGRSTSATRWSAARC